MPESKEVTADDPLLMSTESLGQLTNPGKLGKWAALYESPSRKIGLVLLFLLFIIGVHHYGSMYASTHPAGGGGQHNTPSSANVIQPLETDQGVVTHLKLGQQILVTIRKGHWVGVSCDPGLMIHAVIKTEDVFWRGRCDGRNDLIFQLDPINWAVNKNIEVPPSSVLQCDIDPDPSRPSKFTEAVVMFEVVTRPQYTAYVQSLQ